MEKFRTAIVMKKDDYPNEVELTNWIPLWAKLRI